MIKKMLLLIAIICGNLITNAQNVTWPRENIIALTSDWKGERFTDGRPKVSDELLERLKDISMEEAWAALREKRLFKYRNEGFVGGWTEEINADFLDWLNHYPNLPMPKKELDDYIKAYPHKIGNADQEPRTSIDFKKKVKNNYRDKS